MDRDQQGRSTPPNDHTHYNEEENMDRVAEAGVEGAFGANPDAQRTLDQMRQDAQDAFGGSGATTDEDSSTTSRSGS